MSSQTLKLSDLDEFCKSLINKFDSQQIVLLKGPLGAGKTELVKRFVSLLGGGESTSPTYSLINEYELEKGPAYHVDLYRIDGAEDLESVGFWDLFENDSLIFIEWPERLNQAQLPLSWSKVTIEVEKTDNDISRIYKTS